MKKLFFDFWDRSFEKLNAFQATSSDIITYYDYNDDKIHKEKINYSKRMVAH